MAEAVPLGLRNQLHQVALDLHGIVLARELEQPTDAMHMRVHHDAFGLLEPDAQDHVRRLAADAGQLNQLRHCVGHLAAVALPQRLSHPENRLRLVPEEAGAVDFLLEHARVGSGGGVALRYFANSAGVTMFTRTSGDCAERIVATSSSTALP